jgi:hypothetical protein
MGQLPIRWLNEVEADGIRESIRFGFEEDQGNFEGSSSDPLIEEKVSDIGFTSRRMFMKWNTKVASED